MSTENTILVWCFLSWARQNWRPLLVCHFDNYIWLACRRKNWYFIKKLPLKSIDALKKSKSPSILWRKYLKTWSNIFCQQKPRPCSTTFYKGICLWIKRSDIIENNSLSSRVFLGQHSENANFKKLFRKSDYLGPTRFSSWAWFFWRSLL